MTPPPKVFVKPLKVFVSYAHDDDAHRGTLAKHLSALEDEGLIAIWHDRKITGGREWAGAIDAALRSADIVLLLISADFLASDYCKDVELAEAIRLHDAAQARVVPVILRSCDWERSRFARFNALPADGLPVVEAAHPDQRFSAVAKGLRKVVGEMLAAAQAAATAAPPDTQVEPASPPSRLAGAAQAPSAAPPANADAKARDGKAAEPSKRKLTIGKVGLFGIELGPIEIPLPQPGGSIAVWGLAVLAIAVLLGIGAYLGLLRGPLADARDAMRMARYDSALESLSKVPTWLDIWPGLAAARETAALGVRTHQPPQDWEAIGRDLRRQRAERPEDIDLVVLEAQDQLRRGDYEQTRALAAAAAEGDPNNAEAWFLLGLVQDWSSANPELALEHYRRAVEAAPRSPQYRNNLARAYLDLGRYDEAIGEYQKISQFPLARVEQALAHWAKGEPRRAADAQREALAMLADAALLARFHNRREWLFFLPHTGVRLAKVEDKRCYTMLGESASRRLAGESGVSPPAQCKDAPLEVRELLADDLCRFVDVPQPALAAVASELRGALKVPRACKPQGPSPQPAAPIGKS